MKSIKQKPIHCLPKGLGAHCKRQPAGQNLSRKLGWRFCLNKAEHLHGNHCSYAHNEKAASANYQ
ncbi:MAG: hypothetical protein RSA55_08970, partial [Clostridia bacterium]